MGNATVISTARVTSTGWAESEVAGEYDGAGGSDGVGEGSAGTVGNADGVAGGRTAPRYRLMVGDAFAEARLRAAAGVDRVVAASAGLVAESVTRGVTVRP